MVEECCQRSAWACHSSMPSSSPLNDIGVEVDEKTEKPEKLLGREPLQMVGEVERLSASPASASNGLKLNSSAVPALCPAAVGDAGRRANDSAEDRRSTRFNADNGGRLLSSFAVASAVPPFSLKTSSPVGLRIEFTSCIWLSFSGKPSSSMSEERFARRISPWPELNARSNISSHSSLELLAIILSVRRFCAGFRIPVPGNMWQLRVTRRLLVTRQLDADGCEVR